MDAPASSLVLYRTRPARVAQAGEKLLLELEGGETTKVRVKDVSLLHPGPLRALADLKRPEGDIQTAWELLAGTMTTVSEIAELAFGAYTPASAWAVWQEVTDGLYFKGTPEQVRGCTAEEVAATRASRAAEQSERRAWEAFVARARAGKVSAEDRRYLREVEDLALGRTERSRVLKALGREESPENAHAALLEFGAWDESVNPYPARLGLNLTPPPDHMCAEASAAGLLEMGTRRDLTHLAAFAVDDAWTDNPDDALSWEPGPGLGRLWVHVADAAALVPSDSALDAEARGRGVSLHQPEGVTPMLPSLATPLLGLGLADVSPALSFAIDLGEDGEIKGLEIVPSAVSVTRLTYESCDEILEKSPFAELLRIAEVYEARRQAAGGTSIDLPEASVKVRAGEVTVQPIRPLRSRTLVENAMILTGEAVARYATAEGIPVPYATQEAPESVAMPAGPPGSYSAMYALRRTMRGSQYRSTPAAHAGLGLEAYTQCTSPLRRYLDLVVHQQLRAHLGGEPLLSQEDIIERIGEVEPSLQAARQGERLSVKHWTLVYLRRHQGWTGRAALAERRGASGIFLVPDLALEAQVHLQGDLPLDSEVTLALRGVDLPRQDARFKIMSEGATQ